MSTGCTFRVTGPGLIVRRSVPAPTGGFAEIARQLNEHLAGERSTISFLPAVSQRRPWCASSVCALRKGAADNPLAGKARSMSIEENKAIVGRWFTEFWGKDFNPDVIDELAAPGI